MHNLVENRIKTYSDMLFKSGPVTVRDYVDDRLNKVHNDLYEDALNKLLYKLGEDVYNNKFEGNIILDKTQLDVSLLSPEKMSLSEFVEAFIKWARRTYKIIEIKNFDYALPSKVYIVNTEFPYNKQQYDLTDYWNTIEHTVSNKSITDLHFDDDTINYAELQYVDYIKGMCKYKSKLSGEEFWVKFDYINSSDDINQYSKLHTFTNLQLKK